jgi:predicted RNA-binding protein with PIN domain
VYEPNASDVERIWSARKQRCESAPCNQLQANSGQRRNQRESRFDSIAVRRPGFGDFMHGRSNAKPTRYLIVDGHSVIFAWPELRKLQTRRSSLAREALTKQLRNYQDWTGVRVVVVFDGKGRKIQETSDPADVQIFYSRTGQTADAIIERLASKYAKRFELMVATSDSMEGETVQACGAEWISPEVLRGLISSSRRG